ncbi:MAG: hypothetical protein AAF411_06425 [Myxococcota bacterium]
MEVKRWAAAAPSQGGRVNDDTVSVFTAWREAFTVHVSCDDARCGLERQWDCRFTGAHRRVASKYDFLSTSDDRVRAKTVGLRRGWGVIEQANQG